MSHYDYSGHTTSYSNITSGANSNQHHGNVYGGVTNNYNNRPRTSTSQRSNKAGRSVADYTVAWICALPVPEWQASQLLFDAEHENIPLPSTATYQYEFGEMNGHNVVMGCLPDTQIGKAAASSVATEMRGVFPNIRIGLLVGVGGGVPNEDHDVRLGDVVIGRPDKDRQNGGVIQYDYGKAMQDGTFKEMGSLNMPSDKLLAALGRSRASRSSKFYDYLDCYREHKRFLKYAKKPNTADRLYKSDFVHASNAPTCNECPEMYQVHREDRADEYPEIHYGTIASGDEVTKDSARRDEIAQKHDIICFEMEAAGLVNRFPCLVVRGICDYCDSHKNKGWQAYAAAAAAAAAKEILRNISPSDVKGMDTSTY
ncbi:putative nucleoside phosphorylase domain-containing protein [Septoria linicola]|nr:putative nucleoside phosphorylase domain-containing protein [Septoria linicola]